MKTNRPSKILPLIAIGSLGFLLGVYTGMSDSPVVGTVINGVFGLVTGVAVVLFGQKREDSGSRSPLAFDLNRLSVLVIVLCTANLLGGFTGIGFRNGYLTTQRTTDEPAISPVDLAADTQLTSEQITKIILIQRALHTYGIGNASTNSLINRVVREVRVSNGESLSPTGLKLIEENLEAQKLFIAECQSLFQRLPAHSQTLKSLSSQEVNAQTKSQLESLHADLSQLPNAYSASEQNKLARDAIRNLMRPDLEVVLEHIQRYSDLGSPSPISASPKSTRWQFVTGP